MFNHLRNCQDILQSGCTILHSHQQSVNVPASPHPHQHLFSSIWIIAILVSVKWYLILGFISLCFKLDHLEHIFQI